MSEGAPQLRRLDSGALQLAAFRLDSAQLPMSDADRVTFEEYAERLKQAQEGLETAGLGGHRKAIQEKVREAMITVHVAYMEATGEGQITSETWDEVEFSDAQQGADWFLAENGEMAEGEVAVVRDFARFYGEYYFQFVLYQIIAAEALEREEDSEGGFGGGVIW